MAPSNPRHIHSSQQPHFQWSRDLEPILRVASGSEVTLDLRDGANNQVRPDNVATALSTFDIGQADPAMGPIYVEDCEPGDVLKVEILELTPMRARLRLSVDKGGNGNRLLTSPHVLAPPDLVEAEEMASAGRYVALGVGPDPHEAAREAVRGLLSWLEAEKGLSRTEAYMLASVAASLALAEVVDMPNYCVSCSIPLKTFEV
ncbi:hypothetical protein MAPG_01039 [Magnaporthiopsis poae ATCC 64411]|uniref:Acetamidase n=1 Tax=Magnaporthiopsis poae (strain ATCC 64411 / 73-15) TaxID=644358 RepID=A0A0C4DMM8_MAGP6|nr:hypothetical protein MAPG_01039 [Magnaporthiopsis poae ATCC 64411]